MFDNIDKIVDKGIELAKKGNTKEAEFMLINAKALFEKIQDNVPLQ